MATKNPKNPTSNPYLQALLDLSDMGYGATTIEQMIHSLREDRKLDGITKKRWSSHVHPEHNIIWVQLAKDQRILKIPDRQYKVLCTLGMYANVNGLIQVSAKDLAAITGIGLTVVRDCIRSLIDCGAIMICRPSVRHAAPIYRVNPKIINKGKRTKQQEDDYERQYRESPEGRGQYILNIPLELVVHEQTIYDDDEVYNRITLAPPEDDQKPKRKRKAQQDDAPLDGQMDMTAWLYPAGGLPCPDTSK